MHLQISARMSAHMSARMSALIVFQLEEEPSMETRKISQ
jgi:hypothetical protein